MAVFSADSVRPTFEEALERTIAIGVRAVKAVLADNFTTVGGITRPKTRTRRLQESERLAMVSEILDHGFRWYGEWGQNVHAIRLELIRRANEEKR